MNTPRSLPALIVCLLVLFGSACSSIPVEERAQKREDINRAAQETIDRMVEREPELREKVDASLGYFVAEISAATAAVIGGGSGIGVLYDKQDSTRTYMNVRRYDLGPGLGVRKFRILLLFNDREGFEDFRRGGWETTVGAETAAGAAGAIGVSELQRAERYDFSVHFLTETGMHAALSIRLLQVSVNYDLTHTGVSDFSIPNIGFTTADETPPDAPRQWDRALPFLAQQLVDKGYDLPMPYGIGITYANVDQDQLLDKLEIGFGGSEKVPIQFVSFANASSKSDSATLKLDAWLFPFMNVFALLGRVDGEAPLEFTIDGTDALNQLGIDCTPSGGPIPLPPSPLCVIDGRSVTVPVNAKFEGTTYGLGTVLAGGWNNWFVTIPFTITYADMQGNETEGTVFTASPRFGRVFPLRNSGNLALYLGGSYLESDLTVTGTVVIPGTTVAVDYKIDQSNKDKWAGILGANWDITKRWSVQAEYNGFTGSRESIIASVGYRY